MLRQGLLRRQLREIVEVARDLALRRYPAFVTGGPLPRGHVPVFCFHSLEPESFRSKIEHLARNGYTTLSGAEYAAVLSGERPAPQQAVVLTFDDGVRDHWDTALPVLERHGLHGIFAPVGLPYLHRKIPFVQKNQLVRGRLGEDEVADAYVEAAEEVAPEVDVPGIMASAPIGDYQRGSERYLRFKYASNRLIPRATSERIMNRLFAEHVLRVENHAGKDGIVAQHGQQEGKAGEHQQTISEEAAKPAKYA